MIGKRLTALKEGDLSKLRSSLWVRCGLRWGREEPFSTAGDPLGEGKGGHNSPDMLELCLKGPRFLPDTGQVGVHGVVGKVGSGGGTRGVWL